MDKFDEELLSAIDEILQYTLGDISTQTIYNYLERKGCAKSEIPSKLYTFSEELRNILGNGRGQMLGSAPILEEAIAERFCAKLGKKLEGRLPMSFPKFIQKLKEEHYHEGNSLL